MTRRVLSLLAVTVIAWLVLSAPAFAVTQTATAGTVSASFSFTVGRASFGDEYFHQRLTITRDGIVAYRQPVSDPFCKPCDPAVTSAGSSSVRVLDIAGTGEPNVILTLYSGGAHCCTIAQVFSYDATTATYTPARYNFADPAYQLKRLTRGGPYRFLTRNPAFEYEFTAYAGSGEPLEILSFAGGNFTDVTRSYPKLIADDATFWFRLFKRNLKQGTGPLSAWAADEEELGHDTLVQTTLTAQLKAGHLVGGFVNGAKYIKLLNRQLIKLGYKK